MKTQILIRMMIGAVASLSLIGCGKPAENSNSYDTSSAEIIGSAIAGAASASDNAGSVVGINESKSSGGQKAIDQLLSRYFFPKAAAASCASAVAVLGASCSGAVMSLNLAGCTGQGLATWSGIDTLTFNSSGACSNASAGGLHLMGSGNSVVITSATGETRTGVAGSSVVVDSNSSGFSSLVGGGLMLTCNSANCSSGGGRTVNILGQHRVLSGAGGNKLLDHTINTPTPLSVTGVGGNKVISSGSIQLQHNLAKFVATSTVNQSLTFSSGCCHPTGGQMVTTFSNGLSGSETVSFGPACGAATVNGNAVNLTQCQ